MTLQMWFTSGSFYILILDKVLIVLMYFLIFTFLNNAFYQTYILPEALKEHSMALLTFELMCCHVDRHIYMFPESQPIILESPHKTSSCLHINRKFIICEGLAKSQLGC